MFAKHKSTGAIYEIYSVKGRVSISLDLNQFLEFEPGDYIIEYGDQDGGYKGFLLLDNLTFNHLYDIVKSDE